MAQAKPRTIITNVHVFDGDDLLPDPQTVIVEGGIITSVSPTSTSTSDEEVTTSVIVDGSNHTLLPGLIDSHVHVGAASDLGACAAWGVTTVCDLGAFPKELFGALKHASRYNNNNSPIADYLGCGLAVFAPEAIHCHFYKKMDAAAIDGAALGPGADIEKWVGDLVAGRGLGLEDHEGDASSRQDNRGVDLIKIIADEPGFTQAQIDALAREARRWGKVSVAHGTTRRAYSRAAQAGVDVLTHVPLDGWVDEAEIQALRARGQSISPTLSMMQLMIGSEHFGAKEGYAADAVANADKPDFAFCSGNVKRLHEAGVPVLAGTDANPFGMMPIPHGRGLHDELVLLVQAGLSPSDALRGATSRVADQYRLADRGRVKSGLRADLILVEGCGDEVMRDVGSVTRGLTKVWLRGNQVVSRA